MCNNNYDLWPALNLIYLHRHKLNNNMEEVKKKICLGFGRERQVEYHFMSWHMLVFLLELAWHPEFLSRK